MNWLACGLITKPKPMCKRGMFNMEQINKNEPRELSCVEFVVIGEIRAWV